MTASNLFNLLPVSDGLLTISGDSAPGPVLADQLARCTNGRPVVIREAVRTTNDDGSVVVRGRTDFLGVPDVTVTATAAQGSASGAVVTIRFNLIEGQSGPNSWRFSRSFTDLPNFFARQRVTKSPEEAAMLPNLLDTLVLSDAAYVIATGEGGVDTVTSAPLLPGLNFVGLCAPAGLLGLLGSLLTGGGPVPLYGPIQIPMPAELSLPIPSVPVPRFPWQMPAPVPGINLVADLGVDQRLGDALRFHTVGLRIYTPTSKDWAEDNPSYRTRFAATAKLDLPSAGMTLDLLAAGIDDPNNLLLWGRFEGVSLGRLAQLIDVAGAGDLAASLPDDVQKGLDTVGQLSLQAISLELGPGFFVQSASVTIGIPDLNTTVVPGFTVESLSATFDVGDPFGPARSLSVVLGGGAQFASAPFGMYVRLPEVEATARLRDDVQLPLSGAFSSVGLPAPPDLRVEQMQLSADKLGNLYFAAAAAQSPPWTLDLGPTPLTVSDVTVIARRPANAAAGGSFSGVIALGDELRMEVAYDTPGNFVMRSELPDVRLRQLVGKLTNQAVPLPGDFDLTFKDSVALIQKSGQDLVFQLATTMEDLGTVAFEVRRTGSGQNAWGFAAGIDMTGLRLSSLPGLGALSAFESVFKLDELLLVVASFDDPAFMFPGLTAFNSPTIRAGNLALPAQAGGVVRGFNAYARWTLDTASREQELLRKFLGLNPSLGITLQVGVNPAQDSRLYVSYDTTIQGHPFSCKFGGQIKDGQVGLFLTGTLQTEIQRQLVRFDVMMLLVANGAFFSGTMLGTITFEGIKLSNLALVIGVSWEAIPSLGIAATLTAGKFQSSLAIFFDSTDPSRSLLAGSVSDLSLKDVLDTFAGRVPLSEVDAVLAQVALVGTSEFTLGAEVSAALDNLQIEAISAAFAKAGVTIPSVISQVLLNVSKPGEKWFLTDMSRMLHYGLVKTPGGVRVTVSPQLYCAPQATFVGALRFDQGIFLNAGLKIMSFDAMAKILVKPSIGISVDGRASRVVIGHEALFCVESNDGKQGPLLSAATFKQPALQDPSLKNPHFLLDGSLTLLGLKRSVYVSLNSKGFMFEIKGVLKPGPNFELPGDFGYDLNGRFNGPKDLGAGGSLNAAVGTIDLGKLGKVKVDSGVTGALDVGVKDKDMWAKFAGGFQLAGETVTLPKVDLDVRTASLLQLPKRLVGLVTDALNGLFKDAAKWAKLVRDGIITGVSDVGEVLRSVYNKTSDQAAQLLRGAGYAAGQVGAALKTGYGSSAQQAAQALKAAGFAAEEVSFALRKSYNATAQQAAQWLKEVGYNVNQVGAALKSAYFTSAQEAARLLKGAGYTANEVGGALKSAYGSSVKEAAQLLKGAGYTVNQVGGALKSAYGSSVKEAAQLLKGAGYTVNQVGGALNSAYGATAKTAAAALKGAGYGVDETGRFVKDSYQLGAKELKSVLNDAGYASGQIKSLFNSLGGKFKDVFEDVGDKLDPRNW